MVGATAFFLCMVPSHITWSCLALCGGLFILPTLWMSYTVYAKIMAPSWKQEQEFDRGLDDAGWHLLKA